MQEHLTLFYDRTVTKEHRFGVRLSAPIELIVHAGYRDSSWLDKLLLKVYNT